MLRLRRLFPLSVGNGSCLGGWARFFWLVMLVACVGVMRVRLGAAVAALGAFAAVMAEVVGVAPATGANEDLKRSHPNPTPTKLDGIIFGIGR